MTISTPSTERHQRKRQAARVRQQRCRARKREAKMANVTNNMDLMKDARRRSLPVLRGPVLIHHRSTPLAPTAAARMSIPLLHHHPTSPFVMYPRRAPASFPASPIAVASLWAASTNSPILSAYSHNLRPSHKEIMARSSLALGFCSTPTANTIHLSPPRALRHLQIPRVTPGAESTKVMPMLPDFDRLERKEETAIDAMLCLHRSGSKDSSF